MKQQADVCFLQETYSTKDIENSWKMQLKGDMFFPMALSIVGVFLSW